MARNIVTTINSMIAVIPNIRMTYDFIQELTKIRDDSITMPDECITFPWYKLWTLVTETLHPEQVELQDWEQQIFTLLKGE